MNFRLKRVAIVVAFALFAGSFVSVSIVKAADDWQRPTLFTVREPVQVDRMVLSPGTYLFQFTSSAASRNVVMIYSYDKKRWDGFVMGIPIYRSGAAENGSFELSGNSGDHQVLQAWFYPGLNTGIQFIARKTAH